LQVSAQVQRLWPCQPPLTQSSHCEHGNNGCVKIHPHLGRFDSCLEVTVCIIILIIFPAGELPPRPPAPLALAFGLWLPVIIVATDLISLVLMLIICFFSEPAPRFKRFRLASPLELDAPFAFAFALLPPAESLLAARFNAGS